MSRTAIRNTLIAALIGTSLTGCATQELTDQALGAAVGCAIGGGIGLMVAGGRGAALGCAAGSALAWGGVKLVQYDAQQTRSQQADAKRYRKVDPDFYGLSRSETETSIKIRTTGTSPSSIDPGAKIKATTDYSIITPGKQANVMVTESWVLKKDGKAITSLESDPQTRSTGGWSTVAEFDVPKDTDSGTYVVEHRVQAGNSYNTGISVFVVN